MFGHRRLSTSFTFSNLCDHSNNVGSTNSTLTSCIP